MIMSICIHIGIQDQYIKLTTDVDVLATVSSIVV